jgi:hypothetical protein
MNISDIIVWKIVYVNASIYAQRVVSVDIETIAIHYHGGNKDALMHPTDTIAKHAIWSTYTGPF